MYTLSQIIIRETHWANGNVSRREYEFWEQKDYFEFIDVELRRLKETNLLSRVYLYTPSCKRPYIILGKPEK